MESWRSTYAGLVSADYLAGMTEEKQGLMWRDLLNPVTKPADTFAFVACKDGKVAGYAAGGLSRDGLVAYRGEVVAIYIEDGYKGQGLGRRLMQASARRLQQNGVSDLIIWVLAGNEGAIKFYRRLGGEKVAVRSLTIGGKEHTIIGYGWSSLASLASG